MLDIAEWKNKVTSRTNGEKSQDIIESLLPDSTSILLLAGRTGIGKTNMALNIAFSLATGTNFLDFRCKKTVVGYIGFEGSSEKMVERIEKISQNFPDPGSNLLFEITSPFRLDREIIKFVKMIEGCRVIIIDPIKYLISGDYCKPKDANLFVLQLQNILNDKKAAAILLHHIRKPNPNSLIDPGDLYELKGAADYVEAATTVLMLERQRHLHKPGGKGFAAANPDLVNLYFAKTRESACALPPVQLQLNRDKLIFEHRRTDNSSVH